MEFDNSPVHSRKDWGLRTARGLTLPTRLVSNLEGTLLPLWVAALKARLNAQRWITSLSWRLIPWLPWSLCWPKCLLPWVFLLLVLPPSLRNVTSLLPINS